MINGIIVVNKPKGITSRDVVNKVSKILNTKKIGHTGTLDPLASGVLVLTIGSATKLSDVITCEEKEYVATAILGIETDTLDIDGNIINNVDTHISKERIVDTLNSFKKTYMQEVPKYSAVKINGKKLYEYARAGINIELPKRSITVKNIELLDVQYEDNKTIIKFSCLVSKGTYIRSLIRDIAYSLNTIGTMSDLIRTRQGNYYIKDSYTIENIQNGQFKYLNLEEILSEYDVVLMDKDLEFKIKNGSKIDNVYNKEYVLFKSDHVLALYKNEDHVLKPYKMFL